MYSPLLLSAIIFIKLGTKVMLNGGRGVNIAVKIFVRKRISVRLDLQSPQLPLVYFASSHYFQVNKVFLAVFAGTAAVFRLECLAHGCKM